MNIILIIVLFIICTILVTFIFCSAILSSRVDKEKNNQ